ncbi:hydantoinase B/oxoprolinase family protein [Microbacterium sp. RD1]|uniref:hydantoinase B/oxoprolinase family protein n=1 Tax=Microbacterium sp. RD1 TaxID=3457313 RepID=UPI003FA55C34
MSADVDPITFEVIAHKFTQLTEEIATTLQRTSGSVVVTEGMDFGVVLADASGAIFSVGDFATVHSTGLQAAIEWTLEHRSENPGIDDGDMFFLSDPWVGVVHQPDVAVLAPIFIDGRLYAWAANTMHMLDTGGSLPGGLNSAAPDVFSEPAPIPPMKILRGSVLQRDVEQMLTRRSRLPELLALDLRAMIAANQVAVRRMKELAATYSPEVLERVIARVLSNAESEFRGRLRSLPDGTWSGTQFVDVSGDGDRRVHAVRATMQKSGDTLHFDLTGSDDQAGFFNSTWPATRGGLLSAILPLLCPDLTWAPGGIMKAVDCAYRPGSFIAATFPAAVSSGPISGGLATASLATVLISRMLAGASEDQQRNAMAVTAACIPSNLFRGVVDDGTPVLHLNIEVVPGGTGARSWRDGDDYSGVMLAAASRIPNIEHQEHDTPLLWLYRRELPDSAGAGRYRGGVAGESALVLYGVSQPMEMMVAAHGVAIPSSAGISGGLPAKSLGFRVFRDVDPLGRFAQGEMPAAVEDFGDTVDWCHPKTSDVTVGTRDVFVSSGAGGGGYGDPLDRDPSRVHRDVVEGYVSPEAAERVYGVVLDGSSVDQAATAQRRAVIRSRRLGGVPVAVLNSPGLTETEATLPGGVAITATGAAACARCGADVGDDAQNPLSLAHVAAGDMVELGVVWLPPDRFLDSEVELLQAFCPGCAALLDTEVVSGR